MSHGSFDERVVIEFKKAMNDKKKMEAAMDVLLEKVRGIVYAHCLAEGIAKVQVEGATVTVVAADGKWYAYHEAHDSGGSSAWGGR